MEPSAVVRVADVVVERIQALIAEHALQPGDKLPAERTLALRLGVSRASLREALRILVSKGLLLTRPGGGTFIQVDVLRWQQSPIHQLSQLLNEDPNYFYDLLEARRTLEGSTAWYAAKRATATDKQRIQSCFDAMLAYQQAGEMQAAAQADAQFHLAIAQASHNVVLVQFMGGLFDAVQSTVSHSRDAIFRADTQITKLETLTAQHRALKDAILRNDAELARATVLQHLTYVEQMVRALDDDAARQQRATKFSQ